MTDDQLASVDLDFLRGVYRHCGGGLDLEVHGGEVAEELGLNREETRAVVARLVRMGYLRDVGSNLRVKITIRTIGLIAA